MENTTTKITAPFSDEQVIRLNEFQNLGMVHPFTCAKDGDDAHIKYEFEKKHKGEDYGAYIKKEKERGVNFPEAVFTQTNLIATNEGWKCPVCDYKQNWAHKGMLEIEKFKESTFYKIGQELKKENQVQ